MVAQGIQLMLQGVFRRQRLVAHSRQEQVLDETYQGVMVIQNAEYDDDQVQFWQHNDVLSVRA